MKVFGLCLYIILRWKYFRCINLGERILSGRGHYIFVRLIGCVVREYVSVCLGL